MSRNTGTHFRIEASGIGHRVDTVTSKKVEDENEQGSVGILEPNITFRARFLVNEHKSPAKSPYGLARDDPAQIAQSWTQDSDVALDEAKVTYGVLSTTDKTGLLKLEAYNILYISRAFHSVGTGRESMRYAYVCMLHHSAVNSARLSLDEANVRAICQTNIRLGSHEWTQIYEGFGFGGDSGATSSRRTRGTALPRDMVNTASNENQEALRQLLPLKSDLHFFYSGGLLDVIKQFPEGQYGFSIRVDTGGVHTVVKVMTPSTSTDDTRVADCALYGGRTCPGTSYGGRHISNDLIVATTNAGESLDESLLTDDIRAKALAALTAVHEAGVAHRDVLLRNFVMDASGIVRIIDFAQAKTNASGRDFQKDRDAFKSAFSRSESRGRQMA
ncbi:Protein kinase, putative [Hondaea fermentalgiana]|uniref:Protein kinase, putative n=1 Tax=Hondaea fermentalgiana TaxID=2315210 RepID=A0A2R5GWV2_9STRA|nr:Protein kinase, putative [Hondaea fermentalgiana]|eukprot:GBG35055.1 Protein kinase, putative [Hondaea fermentalgiana]